MSRSNPLLALGINLVCYTCYRKIVRLSQSKHNHCISPNVQPYIPLFIQVYFIESHTTIYHAPTRCLLVATHPMALAFRMVSASIQPIFLLAAAVLISLGTPVSVQAFAKTARPSRSFFCILQLIREQYLLDPFARCYLAGTTCSVVA
jgi:hypothetical protein